MNRRNIRNIVAIVAVLLLAAAVALFLKTNNGTLDVELNIPDTKDLQLKIDGEQQAFKNLRPAYKLPRGTHKLSASKPGYGPFESDITIARGKVTTLTITMQRTQNSPADKLPATVTRNLELPGVSVVQTTYFYEKTWAFAKIETPDGNTGFIVARYDDTSDKWVLEKGPGTSFSQDSLTGVPNEVVTYMQKNDLVDEGGFDEQ